MEKFGCCFSEGSGVSLSRDVSAESLGLMPENCIFLKQEHLVRCAVRHRIYWAVSYCSVRLRMACFVTVGHFLLRQGAVSPAGWTFHKGKTWPIIECRIQADVVSLRVAFCHFVGQILRNLSARLASCGKFPFREKKKSPFHSLLESVRRNGTPLHFLSEEVTKK